MILGMGIGCRGFCGNLARPDLTVRAAVGRSTSAAGRSDAILDKGRCHEWRADVSCGRAGAFDWRVALGGVGSGVAGWTAAVLLVVRAVPTLGQDLLYEAGGISSARLNADDWLVVRWRLMLWTPWVLIGAMLFALALHQRRRRRLSGNTDVEVS
ncbi:hypothetical protein [Amycolatopsis echigonensis]|uniref:hypothetical protein n=1 Tax=Amycolatopsis echigonensis TaxID=2576905 RepID=UPI001305008C|nr:hypothetical protein [Amycolatopsis niigatensis]